MKRKIQKLLKQSVDALVDSGTVSEASVPATISVDSARRAGQGDYATGVALSMARPNGLKPAELATIIQDHLPAADFLDKTEVAGPGFINFFLSDLALADVVAEILEQSNGYGAGDLDNPDRILLEFVSANPTGPLHVGHGRSVAFGDALARLLRVAGHQVDTEYYVNDLGRQMDILCASVWIRFLQLHGKDVTLPVGAYQGEYIMDCAKAFREQVDAEFANLESDPPDVENDDKDLVLTKLISWCRQSLGNDDFNTLRQFVLTEMVEMIREDLKILGVVHDEWYFESRLLEQGDVERAVSQLQERGFLYQSEGATWFRSSEFGDEKDRVLVRSNGDLTYFASDIAYHLDKLNRDYNYVMNIWGADHHGYIARMMAALQAAGEDPNRLKILLVQLASLYRASVKIPMSTRAGEFVTLRELVEETGKDAARFFYVLRKSEQQLDFDLDLAKEESSENPVYYVQYAHARICSIFRQMSERGIARGRNSSLSLLATEAELGLIKSLVKYPEVIQNAASSYEPHQVAYYLRNVATEFHSFYNKERILDCEPSLRSARLDLIDAVRQVLANGLNTLGVSTPESM